MTCVMRYAILLALAAASVWGLLGASAAIAASKFLVDAGHAGADAEAPARGFWLLAASRLITPVALPLRGVRRCPRCSAAGTRATSNGFAARWQRADLGVFI